MNGIDRHRMGRLYTALSRWPWWNRGLTTGIRDLAEFAADMQKLQPMFLAAVTAISRCDDPTEDPDKRLQELEDAIDEMHFLKETK